MADHAPDPAGQARHGPRLTGERAIATDEEAAAEAARAKADAIEAGRLLFAAECRFFYAAQSLDQLPPPGKPEVAFAGRSNVGKSSLINALTGQRALARAS
ncbi:MAG: 50S ribosome-binding GTPase, partial [Rhodospirillales bacterium]|nr:50S ribosome-binding GTPase [Rhodospirillales bacterium]